MANAASAPRRALSPVGRWALVGGLLAALLLLGVYDVAVLSFLTKWWQQALATAGLLQQVEAFQQGISGSVVKRPLPVVATYAVGYLSICLLLLRLLLPAPAQWRLVLRLYAGTLTVYVALVLVGKLGGDLAWAYRLSRQLLDFVVSPLPVAGLYVLLRSGIGAPARP